MKTLVYCLVTLAFFGMTKPVISQDNYKQLVDSIFADRGEVYFTFDIADKEDIHTLTRLISIDQVKGNKVHAYANKKEFSDFLRYQIEYRILPHPGSLLTESEINPGYKSNLPGNRTVWNFYPTYQQYVDYMVGFVV
ncbi:MAG: hypothetical protein NTW16_06310 [Bacteroidetes bacterium]|nr:hypothetical protein [Bacteroidota bacterium]